MDVFARRGYKIHYSCRSLQFLVALDIVGISYHGHGCLSGLGSGAGHLVGNTFTR